MIRMSLGNEPYIERDTGKPLEGRLTVYLHDTDTVATVYTLEGPDFVEAENPQLVHGGSVDDSLFAQTGIYDLRLERYIGTPGQMSAESPDSDFEQVDVLECGIDFDLESMTANQVDFVADLRNVAPEIGAVTVRWYESAGDCVPRVYVWDAASVNTEDGGYVIGSDVSDTGRWILLWDDEQLPASVYGVTPGNESNMGPLLNYPDTVGSFGLKTAPIVRFQAGTYSTALSYATSRTLAFDSGAKFTGATFVCPSAFINGTNSDYVADFEFSGDNVTACSSWFRSVNAFWNCHALVFHVDSTNYFESYALSYSVTLHDKVIEGASLFNVSYNGTYFQLENTTIPDGFFNPSRDYVILVGNYGDKMFASGTWDPGLVSSGHHVQYSSAPSLTRFENTSRWLSVMTERKNRIPSFTTDVLDFQGRSVDSITSCPFGTIMNAHVTGAFGVTKATTTIKNVICDGAFTQNCSILNVYSSSLKYSSEPPNGSTITCWDSRIESSVEWGPKASIELHGCRWAVNLNYATDNTTSVPDIVAYDSTFDASGATFRIKGGYFYGCSFVGQTIRIYPFTESTYRTIKGAFVGCELNSGLPIIYTFFREVGGVSDTGCKNIRFNYRWENNTFAGNSLGITIPFWSFAATKSRYMDSGNQTIVYEGNTGKCPAGQFRGAFDDSVAWVKKRNEALGTDWYVRTSSRWRMFPKTPDYVGYATSSIGFCHNIEGKTFRYGFCSAFNLQDENDNYDMFDFWAISTSDQHSGTNIVIV